MRTKPRFRSLAPFMVFALTMSTAIAIGMARPGFPQVKRVDYSAQQFEEGSRLFHARCGYCHLAGGTGTIMLGRRLGKDRALLESRSDLTSEYVKKITRVGLNSMPPHTRIEVPDSELDLIAAFITRPASARAQLPPDGAAHE
ncbi:MAG TPA: cytochrome c [Candidatus Cybelea sp.]|nr:cytochrome c [Candidatus Cybelea sp.]